MCQMPASSPSIASDNMETASTLDSQWTDLTARPEPTSPVISFSTVSIPYCNIGLIHAVEMVWDVLDFQLKLTSYACANQGHSIIPGIALVGTLLCHGRGENELPTIPEWTAIDPEHLFLFCGVWNGNDTNFGCWQLTLLAMRPLKVLYFDGSSAANFRNAGTLEAQDLLIEYIVLIHLTIAWSCPLKSCYAISRKAWSLFLRTISHCGGQIPILPHPSSVPLNGLPPHLHRPGASSDSLDLPDDDPAFPADDIIRFETIRAGSWHNHYPGETRITLDLTGFVSFYDTVLAPSLVAGRQGVERCDHRLAGISSADLEATLYRVVLERCVQRLELLYYLLNMTMPHNVNERARQIQTQLRVMLTPYILYTSRPMPRGISASVDYTSNDLWALPVWQACASRHTARIHTSAALQSRLTPSERLLLRALDETNREICRVVMRVWVAVVQAGFDILISLDESQAAANPLAVVGAWHPEAAGLMKWLDWGV
ncbi:hypothetical protein DFH08DRAFT_1040932 [Mycena albidolilacea]|uniref:Uncharacterized protein n=1 Tax=Mycena albidolilacea TaxID=1033008 RepID=A0AAD7EDE6_9AGAR|nr:hypothetical protein DFH08DRAFT_1040932 [Mycena albidolilacea]